MILWGWSWWYMWYPTRRYTNSTTSSMTENNWEVFHEILRVVFTFCWIFLSSSEYTSCYHLTLISTVLDYDFTTAYIVSSSLYVLTLLSNVSTMFKMIWFIIPTECWWQKYQFTLHVWFFQPIMYWYSVYDFTMARVLILHIWHKFTDTAHISAQLRGCWYCAYDLSTVNASVIFFARTKWFKIYI